MLNILPSTSICPYCMSTLRNPLRAGEGSDPYVDDLRHGGAQVVLAAAAQIEIDSSLPPWPPLYGLRCSHCHVSSCDTEKKNARKCEKFVADSLGLDAQYILSCFYPMCQQ